MTAAQIIDAVERAGATLIVEDGKARVRGAKLPAELLELLKSHKARVIAEVSMRQELNRNRYGKVPPHDAPMVAGDVVLSDATRELVQAHVFRQGRPLHAWVQTRGQKYFEAGTPAAVADAFACVDVLAWQRCASASQAVKWLTDLPTAEELVPRRDEGGEETTKQTKEQR